MYNALMSEGLRFAPHEPAQSKEVGERKPYALFIAGGMGTDAGCKGIDAGLKAAYGEDHVKTFNSELNFIDPQNRERFEQMADYVINNISSGVHVILHSLSVAEGRRMARRIKKKAPDFFKKKENTDNLHITIIAGASRKGLLGPFRFIGKTTQFAREQAETPIAKKNTLLRGVDALTAFPPANMTDEKVTRGMRAAMPELSQHRRGIEVVPFVSATTHMSKLTPEQQLVVENFDEQLQVAIEQRNHAWVRELVALRGEALRGPLAKVYEGESAKTDTVLSDAKKVTVGGYISLLRTITSSIFNRPMREMAKLQRKGVRTDFVVPEYDIWMPLDEAIEFFDTPEKGRENVVIAERGAHAYLALQPKLFGKTMYGLYSKSV